MIVATTVLFIIMSFALGFLAGFIRGWNASEKDFKQERKNKIGETDGNGITNVG